MAQTTRNLLATTYAFADYQYPSTVYDISNYQAGGKNMPSLKRTAEGVVQQMAYYQFESWPSSLKNRRLYTIEALLAYDSLNIDGQYRGVPLMSPLTGIINPATLTWTNRPGTYDTQLYLVGPFREASSGHEYYEGTLSIAGKDDITATDRSELAKLFLTYSAGQVIEGWTGGNYTRTVWTSKYLVDGSSKPYLKVTYDDSINVASKITYRSGPTSGYVNPRNDTAFSWAFDRDPSETYYCAGGFTQASAVFHWKASGGSWNTISASGSTQNLTVAANTFPTNSSIEWYLTGTDNAGTASESTHYTFSTAAGSAYVTPIRPINTVEDGSQRILFQWSLGSTDGQTPIYLDLQYKLASANSWTSVWSKHAVSTDALFIANYFPAGEIQWRMRAYNVDDVAGAWCSVNGNPPSFICVAAPAAPQGLAATAVPRTTITWQATDQEAYEIEIDGETVAKAYSSTVNSWKLNGVLDDGDHVIRVRIQGVYGLWSAWSSITINVENVPPSTITLTGNFGVDAVLSATIPPGIDSPNIHWYRDGKRIALTHGVTEFTDRVVLGNHNWHCELWYTTGYYTQSNTVTGTLKSCETRIAELKYLSPWMVLELSENSDSVQGFSWSQASSLRHIRGAEYPVLEIGKSEDMIGKYDCAFKDVKDARALEAFKGKIVIIKSRGGNVLIGALTSLSKQMKDFYITYSFSVQQIHREDFIDYDAIN